MWVPGVILTHDFTDNCHNGETLNELGHLLVYILHMSSMVVGAAMSKACLWWIMKDHGKFTAW